MRHNHERFYGMNLPAVWHGQERRGADAEIARIRPRHRYTGMGKDRSVKEPINGTNNEKLPIIGQDKEI